MTLDEAIRSLPDSPDGIAALLAAKGVVGATDMVEHSALAHYIALVAGTPYARVQVGHRTGTGDRCGVDGHDDYTLAGDVTLYSEYRHGDRRLICEAPLPMAARVFEHRFAAGVYPLLDAARLDFDPEEMWAQMWEQDRGLAPPEHIRRVANPVGLKEIAEHLGVQRATVDMWQSRRLLPGPRWTVGGRPAWAWRDVEEWAVKTGRLSAPQGHRTHSTDP